MATKLNYDESLFSKLAEENLLYLVNIQYEMDPKISNFSSKKFYKSKLENELETHVTNRQP